MEDNETDTRLEATEITVDAILLPAGCDPIVCKTKCLHSVYLSVS